MWASIYWILLPIRYSQFTDKLSIVYRTNENGQRKFCLFVSKQQKSQNEAMKNSYFIFKNITADLIINQSDGGGWNDPGSRKNKPIKIKLTIFHISQANLWAMMSSVSVQFLLFERIFRFHMNKKEKNFISFYQNLQFTASLLYQDAICTYRFSFDVRIFSTHYKR